MIQIFLPMTEYGFAFLNQYEDLETKSGQMQKDFKQKECS